MIKIILLSVCFILAAYASADESGVAKIKSCAGYQYKHPFKADSRLGEILYSRDMTGDGKIDNLRQWDKFGTALEINCGDGDTYIPIVSNTGIGALSAKTGVWSGVLHSSFPRGDEEEQDFSTWIDGKLHFFDSLPFDASASLNSPLQGIHFHQGQYTTDLTYCPAFDLYTPRYKIAPPDPRSESLEPAYLTLLLKSGQYRIVNAGTQSTHSFNDFKEADINQDDIKDGYLEYHEIHGAGAQGYSGAMLGCGDDTYIYVPDHKLADIIKRGK